MNSARLKSFIQLSGLFSSDHRPEHVRGAPLSPADAAGVRNESPVLQAWRRPQPLLRRWNR